MHNLAVFAIACTLVCASFVSAVPVTVDPLENQNLFEGDLDIPEEMIQLYYGESNDTGSNSTNGTTVARTTRAATSDQQRLWPGGNVRFSFDSSVSLSLRDSIRDAMDIWEDATCLRFVARSTDTRDYIEFTSDAHESSSYVGRRGGRQLIRLKYSSNVTEILHEIGHAVGFWHEQSRPDRDKYVRILAQNIEDGETDNFQKRNDHHEIDYQGVSYDYDSIMHFSKMKYSRNGQPTIEVSDATEYARQGRPYIGQRSHLSQRDIEQANRLYHCRNSGIRGILNIYIDHARDLPDTDRRNDNPDPYVLVTAVDSFGQRITRRSSTRRETVNPRWNQWINMGGREWQFFRLRVWDDDGSRSSDDAMSMSQTVPLSPGTHSRLFRCADPNCHGRMYFAYNLIEDGNECSPQPCRNGGTCVDGFSRFTCNCRTGYFGKYCQYRTKKLRFFVRYGHGLPDRDPIWNDSDPYLEVIAYDYFGNSVRRTTRYIRGDESPDWNEWLHFGTHAWWRFSVQVWDKDSNADDALSSRRSYDIRPSGGAFRDNRLNTYSGGYVYFDYYYVID